MVSSKPDNCPSCTDQALLCAQLPCSICNGSGCRSSDCTSPQTTIIGPPPYRNPSSLIPSTPFAPSYRSIFTLLPTTQTLLSSHLLDNLNCSYLSTPGVAPTLVNLKKHIHSLLVLIKSISISTTAGAINGKSAAVGEEKGFPDSTTFDFLNDLTAPYHGPQTHGLKHHHGNLPLTSLLNTLETRTHNTGCTLPTQIQLHDTCPLHQLPPEFQHRNMTSLPYATNQTLISHANEILELLDHQYSATGGLLSILPSSKEAEERKERRKKQQQQQESRDREKAETTILGQYILFTQRLVARVHELERNYANALDGLAGEALVPRELLGRLGGDGRVGMDGGEVVVVGQDRFILANCGDEVYGFLNREFDKVDLREREEMERNLKMGVTGESLWGVSDGLDGRGGSRSRSRGLSVLDVKTRYMRLRNPGGGNGNGPGEAQRTIFVIPVHEVHPGVETTRDLERGGTVVSVVKPVWPERSSRWEIRMRGEMEEGRKARVEVEALRREVESKREAERVLMFEIEGLRKRVRDFEKGGGVVPGVEMLEGDDSMVARENWHEEVEKAKEREREAMALEVKVEREREELRLQMEKLIKERKEWEKERGLENRVLKDRVLNLNADMEERGERLKQSLQDRWRNQMVESEALHRVLKRLAVDMEDVMITDEDRLAASEKIERIFRGESESESVTEGYEDRTDEQRGLGRVEIESGSESDEGWLEDYPMDDGY